jgi:hypothetical protein
MWGIFHWQRNKLAGTNYLLRPWNIGHFRFEVRAGGWIRGILHRRRNALGGMDHLDWDQSRSGTRSLKPSDAFMDQIQLQKV